MHIKERSLDDILHKVYEKLLKGKSVTATRGGILEARGASLTLTNPRSRLSISESRGKIFSALGELLWYLSGSNRLSDIAYYIKQYAKDADEDGTIYGAYGPRLIRPNGFSQIENVVSLLSKSKTSKRAVIQLYDANDIVTRQKEIPCTCVIQFLVRGNRLYAYTYMRSNDAFLGLPHDIFSFTMIQELIARRLKVQLGTYTHFVGSLHIYQEDIADVKRYLEEGWQEFTEMPRMPDESIVDSLGTLMNYEHVLRTATKAPRSPPALSSYWADLATLLRIFRAQKKRLSSSRISELIHTASPVYTPYILGLARRAREREEKHARQAELFN
jgi:thymidylate synthase